MIKSFFRFLLPLLTGTLIIAAAGVMIHLYRSTWSTGSLTSPVLPRAQISFSVHLPDNRSGQPQALLLRVVKTGNAFLSVSYWHVGRTVFQMPVLDPPAQAGEHPQSLRLALWDPGRYTLTFADDRTGNPVQSFSLRVATPLGLYRNDLILFLLLGIAGYMSGRMAIASLPTFSISSRIFSLRKTLFLGLLSGGVFLILLATPLVSRGPTPAKETPRAGLLESEGRADAPRMVLPLPAGPAGKSADEGGFLVLRHRLDSWLRFGQDLTFFEGPVDRSSSHRAFILPPDDGRYRLTLWTGEAAKLSFHRSAISAIPVSPGFPLGLFSGLTLFASSFFLLGFTRVFRPTPKTTAERLH
ncbi:MAG: hypothetical protein M1313_00810 [Nitrospirae bacterium]|nr:hypothetical protein [Nitrospirota bacterium]